MWLPRMFKSPQCNCEDMATDLTKRVQEIAEARGIPESEILEQALERGVEDLWIDLILSRYVNDEIDRETAVELVGRDRVKRAERELQAVEDDVRWGLNA
jgi:predicted transcriptional regulator